MGVPWITCFEGLQLLAESRCLSVLPEAELQSQDISSRNGNSTRYTIRAKDKVGWRMSIREKIWPLGDRTAGTHPIGQAKVF
jgi:hypothetical protein